MRHLTASTSVVLVLALAGPAAAQPAATASPPAADAAKPAPRAPAGKPTGKPGKPGKIDLTVTDPASAARTPGTADAGAAQPSDSRTPGAPGAPAPGTPGAASKPTVDLFPAKVFDPDTGTAARGGPRGPESRGPLTLGDDTDWRVQAAQVGVMVAGFAALAALCGGGKCMLPDSIGLPGPFKAREAAPPVIRPPQQIPTAR